MSEPDLQDKIPFEEHPLYPLYQAGRQQWNSFMVEYLEEEQKAKIIERNAIMAEDFKSAYYLPYEQVVKAILYSQHNRKSYIIHKNYALYIH